MSDTPLAFIDAYRALLDSDEISPDPAQENAAQFLQKMYELCADRERVKRDSSFFRFLRGSGNKHEIPEHCGLYLWGGVGRGKTMLMDMFCKSLPAKRKRRIHFHAFMIEIHKQLHAMRQDSDGDHVIVRIANEIAVNTRILCLDELQVHDITDAMIVGELFTELFRCGVQVVFTSNRPPADLYKGGLQRERFLGFIALLEKHLTIHELASPTDYRYEQMHAVDRVFFTPADDNALAEMFDIYSRLTHHNCSEIQTIYLRGRTLTLEKTCGDVAWCTFDELCARPLGPEDYIEIAQLFHVLILQDIPLLTPESRNEAKRFVALIDALYEQGTILICSAAARAEALYPKGDGSFEFERTTSRLIEMQSEEYLRGLLNG